MGKMSLFKKAMGKELENNKHKGDFQEWCPHPLEWLWEINHHLHKLQKAIQDGNKDKICEYSADVGNHASKSFYLFGKPTECRMCDGTGEVLMSEYGTSKCSNCNGTGRGEDEQRTTKNSKTNTL